MYTSSRKERMEATKHQRRSLALQSLKNSSWVYFNCRVVGGESPWQIEGRKKGGLEWRCTFLLLLPVALVVI